MDGIAGESQLAYLPYGSLWQSLGRVPTGRHFTGERENAALGLIHMGARFYDPYLTQELYNNPESDAKIGRSRPAPAL